MLLWLSGADLDTLAKVPREARKYVGLGGLVLTTAVLAMVSATFALYVGLRAPVVVALLVGLGWGLAIMNMDRWLISAAQRQRRWYLNLMLTTPRLLLALIIGTVVSTPMVLWIFNQEIESELNIVQRERDAAYQVSLTQDPRFQIIPGLEKSVAENQRVVDGTAPATSAAAGTEVGRLQEQFDKLDKEFQAAQKAATCELDGTCGTDKPGSGTAFRTKQDVADELKDRRDEVGKRLDTAVERASAADATASQSARRSAADNLAADKAQLAGLVAERDRLKARHDADSAENRGLLARLEALSHFTKDNSTLRSAYVALFLFITALEILPVFAKLLMNLAAPSLYDKIVGQADAKDEQTARAAIDYEHTAAVHYINSRAERDREVIDDTRDRMVTLEADVYRRTIDRWHADQVGRMAGEERAPSVRDRLARLTGLPRQTRPRAARDPGRADDFSPFPEPEETTEAPR
ncbi:hypothetical protein AFR_16310 [Actinoplanes friuliensis DSM 7358]|uniref:DUF4407 domain-containing protein n=1 Tax=Actinoplanes friuliensis DSM 7358 TaxID=1246995 RepID=U5VXH5_9ACTN|nr:hypothetical protein AFR_16310 [Actinoplanes friuliensis DSM 7358]